MAEYRNEDAPNALHMGAEAVGMRIRLNGGTMPSSLWMVMQWSPDLIRDNEDDEEPSFVSCHTSREDAIATYLQDSRNDFEDMDSQEPDPEHRDLFESMLTRTEEGLRTHGSAGVDETYDGMRIRLSEVVLWTGVQRA